MSDHAHLIMRICNTNLQVDSNSFNVIIDHIVKNDLKEDFSILNKFYNNSEESKSYNIKLFRSSWHKILFSEKLEHDLEEKKINKNLKI